MAMKGDDGVLPPYELQKKKFSKAIKGYSTAEVDEHLAFVTAKYTELYTAYNELECRLRKVEAELGVCRKNEEMAERAMLAAQTESQKIIDEAKSKAQSIRDAAKSETDRILHEFQEQVKSQKDALRIMRARVVEFRNNIYSQYHQHIEFLESIIPELGQDEDDWNLEDEEYVTMAVHQIRLDVAKGENDGALSGQANGASAKNPFEDEMLERMVSERENFRGIGQMPLGYGIGEEPLVDVRKKKKEN